MKFLIDTHVLIWLATEPEKVPERVKARLDESDDVGVSFASGWEHGIKRAKYPERLLLPFEVMIEGSEFRTLDLPFSCYRFSENLPAIHADPFDRMLVAHALATDRVLVTKDEMLHRYPVETLW